MKKTGIVLTTAACALNLTVCAGGKAETTAALTEALDTEGTADTTTGTTTGTTTDAATDTITTQIEVETRPPAGLSGKVVVYIPSPVDLADKLAAGLEGKTGVKVGSFQGATEEILARLEAERTNLVTDVVILVSWANGLSMKGGRQLTVYKAVGTNRVSSGWVDEGHMFYGTSASAVGVIYNTMIFPSLDAGRKDLADTAYRNQLAIPGPEKSGACKDFLSGFIAAQDEGGWDIWQALADNGMTVPGVDKVALEAVTTEEKGILVASVDYNAYFSEEKGEPLDIYYPVSGTVADSQPTMISKTSPNVNSARTSMDCLTNDEAQQLVADAYLLPGRSDMKYEDRTSLEEIPRVRTDRDKMTEISVDTATRLNEICW